MENNEEVKEVSTSSKHFYAGRDEELRALRDENLDHGAARFFCLLAKLVWFPEAGGKHRGLPGVIAISMSELRQNYLGSDKKSIVRWIQQLESGNYIWISKQHIKNTHAMNVYHIEVLHSRNNVASAGWQKSSFVSGGLKPLQESPSENPNENEVFSNNTHGQGVLNPRAGVSDTHGQGALYPRAGVSSTHGQGALNPQQCTNETPCQGYPMPPASMAPDPLPGGLKPPCPGVPMGHLRENLDYNSDIEILRGGEGNPPPPVGSPSTSIEESTESKLQEWKESLKGKFDSKIEKMEKELLARLEALPKLPDSRDFSKGSLTKDIIEYLYFADEKIEALKGATDHEKVKELKDRLKDRERVLSKPSSYLKIPLKPEVEAEMAMIKRKLAILDEKLRGPKV